MEPLPYSEPVLEEVELVEEEIIEPPKHPNKDESASENDSEDTDDDEDGQITLF